MPDSRKVPDIDMGLNTIAASEMSRPAAHAWYEVWGRIIVRVQLGHSSITKQRHSLAEEAGKAGSRVRASELLL